MFDFMLNRRDFFRKATKQLLPVFVLSAIPSSFFTACKSDDCSDCSSICSSTCSSTCANSSGNGCSSCSSTCSGSCYSSCTTTCEGTSSSIDCTSCSGGCVNGCSNNCTSGVSNNGGEDVPEGEISLASGKVDGYEYVDLGLSVKWARYNIGASKPEGYGTYQLWGDKGGGNQFNPWLDTYGSMKKGDTICGTNYDNAVSKWGSKWRMPTKAQFQELIDNCEISTITLNNHEGIKFKSKKNGKSIFLPFADAIDWLSGSWKKWTYYIDGCYWSGELSGVGNVVCDAYYLYVYKSGASIGDGNLFDHKYSIRPVTTGSGGGGGGCTGSSCSSNCANNSTSSGCTGCSTGCSSSCKTTCEGSCINGCNTLCGGQCRYSCGGTCSYVSAGSSCTSSTCARTCSSYCYTTCTMACSSSCQSQCIYGSK